MKILKFVKTFFKNFNNKKPNIFGQPKYYIENF